MLKDESRISPNYVPPVPVNPGGLTLIRANLVSLWVETVLFGVFLVLFIAAVYLLYVKRDRKVCMTRVLLAVSVTMLLLITGVSPHCLIGPQTDRQYIYSILSATLCGPLRRSQHLLPRQTLCTWTFM